MNVKQMGSRAHQVDEGGQSIAAVSPALGQAPRDLVLVQVDGVGSLEASRPGAWESTPDLVLGQHLLAESQVINKMSLALCPVVTALDTPLYKRGLAGQAMLGQPERLC